MNQRAILGKYNLYETTQKVVSQKTKIVNSADLREHRKTSSAQTNRKTQKLFSQN